jgi:hypothetical protein
VWPDAEESLSFIEAYEAERGNPFTRAERDTALAACVYLRAYAARCHHAYAGDAHDSRLAEFADALLGLVATYLGEIGETARSWFAIPLGGEPSLADPGGAGGKGVVVDSLSCRGEDVPEGGEDHGCVFLE